MNLWTYAFVAEDCDPPYKLYERLWDQIGVTAYSSPEAAMRGALTQLLELLLYMREEENHTEDWQPEWPELVYTREARFMNGDTSDPDAVVLLGWTTDEWESKNPGMGAGFAIYKIIMGE